MNGCARSAIKTAFLAVFDEVICAGAEWAAIGAQAFA